MLPRQPVVRAQVLPEPAAAAGIAKQMRASARACGVFNVAKMFLERPERFVVRVTALAPEAMLFQVGNGPVALDRAAVERGVFQSFFRDYYATETTQGEPPKGNYTSVARDRFSGALLGPSNHHSYQVSLRKLYDERYKRRLEYNDFLRNIEMVSDPAVVEQWKVQASSVTTIKTKVEEGQEPIIFKTEQEAEQHFRATFLPALVKSGNSLDVSGASLGGMIDRDITFPMRDAVEQERRVPLGIVNALRPYFNEAGLHLFKWKKKMLFASGIRPQRHPAAETFSDGISGILTTVGEQPGIKRPELAAKLLLGITADAPEATAKKEALASDLHYLIHIGYVVEFQNGCLELPQSKKEIQAEDGKADVAAEMAALAQSAAPKPAQKAAQKPAAPAKAPALEPAPVAQEAVAQEAVAQEAVAQEAVAEQPAVEEPAPAAPEPPQELAAEPPVQEAPEPLA